MPGDNVADVIRGQPDLTGVVVDTIYVKVSERYVVYRNQDRVALHFADDEKLGADQRQALAPLQPLRGQINGLVDGWRVSKSPRDQAKARIFDRRLADGLIVALQGDPERGVELLTDLKADVVAERTSVARTEYLLVAFLSAIVLIVAVAILTVVFSSTHKLFPLATDSLIVPVTLGSIGALFSIGLQIRSREILTDLQRLDNSVDAALRVGIGAVSAVILFYLIRGKIVLFGFGSDPLSLDDADHPELSFAAAVVIAFAAGFSERLVSNFFAGATIAAVPAAAANPIAGTAAPPTSPTKSPQANEQNPLGKPPPAAGGGPDARAAGSDDDEHEHTDSCPCDAPPLQPAELTSDTDLPATTGGVAAK